MSKTEPDDIPLFQLQTCKKRLFTDQDHDNYRISLKQGEKEKTIKKRQAYLEQIPTPIKKIILKRKLKTEMFETPLNSKNVRIKTSPNKPNLSRQKYLNLDVPKKIYEHKKYNTTLTEAYSNSIPRASIEKLTITYTDLKPSPKKYSLPFQKYSQLQQSNLPITSSSKEKQSSKEKKKIHFTVYDDKECKRGDRNVVKRPKYQIPYRFTTSITIDLFDPDKSHSLQKKKEGSSFIIKKSLQRLYGSVEKKQHFTKTSRKPHFDEETTIKIERTQQKLHRYRFIKEYMEKWEILQYIQELIKREQPQFRWALLIIDKVFQRMKGENSLEVLSRK